MTDVLITIFPVFLYLQNYQISISMQILETVDISKSEIVQILNSFMFLG